MPVSGPMWPYRCRCGETWSETEWLELPAIGRYDAGRDGFIELRTCYCGAALSIPCEAPPAAPPHPPAPNVDEAE